MEDRVDSYLALLPLTRSEKRLKTSLESPRQAPRATSSPCPLGGDVMDTLFVSRPWRAWLLKCSSLPLHLIVAAPVQADTWLEVALFSDTTLSLLRFISPFKTIVSLKKTAFR